MTERISENQSELTKNKTPRLTMIFENGGLNGPTVRISAIETPGFPIDSRYRSRTEVLTPAISSKEKLTPESPTKKMLPIDYDIIQKMIDRLFHNYGPAISTENPYFNPDNTPIFSKERLITLADFVKTQAICDTATGKNGTLGKLISTFTEKDNNFTKVEDRLARDQRSIVFNTIKEVLCSLPKLEQEKGMQEIIYAACKNCAYFQEHWRELPGRWVVRILTMKLQRTSNPIEKLSAVSNTLAVVDSMFKTPSTLEFEENLKKFNEKEFIPKLNQVLNDHFEYGRTEHTRQLYASLAFHTFDILGCEDKSSKYLSNTILYRILVHCPQLKAEYDKYLSKKLKNLSPRETQVRLQIEQYNWAKTPINTPNIPLATIQASLQ